MKKKDKETYRAMTIDELRKEVTQTDQGLMEKRLGKQKTQMRNVHEAKSLRIKRAVLATLVREKELTI